MEFALICINEADLFCSTLFAFNHQGRSGLLRMETGPAVATMTARSHLV
jgi:hypothetical protein